MRQSVSGFTEFSQHDLPDATLPIDLGDTGVVNSLLKKSLLCLLAFNAALVLLSALLSLHSTLTFPMQGRLIAVGDHQLHVIDSLAAENTSVEIDLPVLAGASTPTQNKVRPTVVLVHGASTSALDFSTNLHPHLSKHWRVVSIDRPGHGYSERPDTPASTDPAYQAAMILDALHTMNIDNAVFIGHSWAGSVVMAALLQNHEHVNVQAGVLIAGVTHPREDSSAMHITLSAKPIIGTVFRWQYIGPMGRLLLSDTLDRSFSPETVPDDYIDNTGLTLSLRPTTYKHNALELKHLNSYLQIQAPRYSKVTQPVLSIASNDDQIVPAWKHHKRLLKQVANSQGINIPGAGHAPHHTQTLLLAGIIETFLSTLD